SWCVLREWLPVESHRINQKETAHADDDADSLARVDRVDLRDLVLAVRDAAPGDAGGRPRSGARHAQGGPRSPARFGAADRLQLQPPARAADRVLCAGRVLAPR